MADLALSHVLAVIRVTVMQRRHWFSHVTQLPAHVRVNQV